MNSMRTAPPANASAFLRPFVEAILITNKLMLAGGMEPKKLTINPKKKWPSIIIGKQQGILTKL